MEYKKLNADNSGEFILMDGHMALRTDIVVKISDYGDEHFDVCLINKKSGDLFGESISAPIKGFHNALKYANDLATKLGIEFKVKKYNC